MILVAAIALAVLTIIAGSQMEIRARFRAVEAMRNQSAAAEIQHYLQSNVSCPTTKLAGCTAQTPLLTSSGAQLLPAATTRLGSLDVTAQCDPVSHSISLRLTKNGNLFKEKWLLCD